MIKNTWGIEFVKVNIKDDKFESLFALNIGDEAKTRALFNQIKSEFTKKEGEPDCVIDLLDEDDSIIDDLSVTKNQVIEIASLLGHKVS